MHEFWKSFELLEIELEVIFSWITFQEFPIGFKQNSKSN